MDRGDETVSERLHLTLELFEFGVEMKAARLRREHPDATGAQIDQMVEDWLAERPGAEDGDGPGVPVALDRFTRTWSAWPRSPTWPSGPGPSAR